MGISSREFALLSVGLLAGIFATCSWQEALRQNSPVARTIHRKIQETSGLLNHQGHEALHTRQREGFYVKPGSEYFVAVAESDGVAKTDKFTAHNYQTIYAKHFELGPGHHRVHKMLEIGLGCNMHTGAGIGASARLWRKYFPTAEIWMAEYDAACLVAKKEEIDRINVKTVAGDQADPVTLARWQQESGGNFDVIIDDGGHDNKMQWQSLLYLFQNSLKPGGMYVIEDMAQGAFDGGCDTDPMCAHMDQVMAQWIQQMTYRDCTRVWKLRPALMGARHYPMLPRLKSVECTAEACTLIKCFEDDTQCDYPSCTDPLAYKSPPAMAAPVEAFAAGQQ